MKRLVSVTLLVARRLLSKELRGPPIDGRHMFDHLGLGLGQFRLPISYDGIRKLLGRGKIVAVGLECKYESRGGPDYGSDKAQSAGKRGRRDGNGCSAASVCSTSRARRTCRALL